MHGLRGAMLFVGAGARGEVVFMERVFDDSLCGKSFEQYGNTSIKESLPGNTATPVRIVQLTSWRSDGRHRDQSIVQIQW
jgi:hypothetical protein